MKDQNIRRQVLVVDDEIVNRQMLGFIVSRDYDVIYAKNGVEALEQISTNQEMLSLILLDLLMPEMDGFEVLRRLQEDKQLSKIPVIVLTSEKSAEIKSLQYGAVDFIPKPYDMPEVILARIRRSIELFEETTIIQTTENDELTGLYTKDFFFKYCEQRDKYYQDQNMDAIVFNINHIQLINELYGRSFGNNIIKRIANVVRNITEINYGIACRYSDTFYIYVPHIDDPENVIEKTIIDFNRIFKNSRSRLVCGINQNADRNIDIYRRFDRAIMACNTLKNNYGTNIAFFDAKLHEKSIFEECLVADMETSLANNNFRVYYQPKFSVMGDKPRLISAEALVRWVHPEFGLINPNTFIPLFENNGLISSLDNFVWREAARQIKEWHDKYNVSIPVSVNVSRIDIYNPNLEGTFLGLKDEFNLTPNELILEITETAYTDNSNQMIKVVENLRAHGFRIEMDDFGTGYSSLNMLSSLPIDTLKLDMKFIKKDITDKDLRMIELVMEIADFLKVPVTAEGVETEEQYKLLKKLGCCTIQGYYFSRPVPADEFNALIEKNLI